MKAWPYYFTHTQLQRLRRAGCRFDTSDFNHAHELHRSGFSSAEVVRAYEDIRQYAAGDRSQLRAIASYRVAGFDLGNYRKYQATSDSLTAYYNRAFARSRSALYAGVVLTVAGLATTIIAAGFLINMEVIANRCERGPDYEDKTCRDLGYGLGMIILGSIAGVGGLTVLVGGGLVLATFNQPHRYLSRPVLDNTDAETLRDFHRWRRMADGMPPAVSLSLSPTLTRSGGGLTLRLRF